MMLVLASASPRRRELLLQIGQKFITEESLYLEAELPGLTPRDLVATHAIAKAREVAGRFGDEAVVIGADTVVVLDGRVFGKPKDETEATLMLQQLSGRWHEVLTGVVVGQRGQYLQEVVTTKVKFGKIPALDIAHYVASGESLDKAGAYGIQGTGALFVEKIEGCYYNVVGLPLYKLAIMLRQFGVPLWK